MAARIGKVGKGRAAIALLSYLLLVALALTQHSALSTQQPGTSQAAGGPKAMAPAGDLFQRSAAFAGTPAPQAASSIKVGHSTKNDVSQPLRAISPRRVAQDPRKAVEAPDNRPVATPVAGMQSVRDSAVQSLLGPLNMPTPAVNFEGISFWNSFPPDTNGDVGPDHYVQWVNLEFQIFTKTGASVYGPAPGNTLWAGFGGMCETTNSGDPIVQYDPLAGRWLMSQFAKGAGGGFYQCVAISQTSDPTGSYNRYAFLMSDVLFNDYPKFGVWPDAYYMSIVNFSGPTFVGSGAVAFDRARMLAGQPATYQQFNINNNYLPLLPADLDGTMPPPAGAPNTFVTIRPTDLIQLWKFHVDWATPANSSFTGPTSLPVAPFSNFLCISQHCIEQPNGPLLDDLSDRPMYRLAYRNYGGHEALVFNHTVNNGSGKAGVRWYEIRNASTNPVIYQQGTFGPHDNIERWMGSIAMDAVGNIALGYSVSGEDLHPGIRYTGRLNGDPLGQMTQGEGSIIEGGGSQGGTFRWGDYSMLAIDPVDDCTYWYTNEYYPVSGVFDWHTRIASFKFPNCTRSGTATPTRTPTSTPTGTPIIVDAYSRFQPSGPLTLTLGSKVVLNLQVNAGSNSVVASQQYLTFTNSILQNVNAATGGCAVSNSVLPDPAVFNTVLQNEVCNGGVPCDFGRLIAPPGSIAFASAAMSGPARTGTFRVASVALCGVAPGRAVVRWQLPPSAPANRQSEVADAYGNAVSNPALYTDLIIDVVGTTGTPTVAVTPTATSIATSTTAPTQTRTATAIPTNTSTATATASATRELTATPTTTHTATATSTSTRTATSTATTVPVLLVGHVTWQGRPAQPHPLQQLPITLTLRLQSGGPEHIFPSQTTDASGYFTNTVGTLPAGTYNWTVDASPFLPNSGSVVLPGSGTTHVEMGLMRTGDINGDSVVDISDFVVLRATFGRSCGMPGFDPRADLNGDCVVDIADFTLLRANFGQGGSPGRRPVGDAKATVTPAQGDSQVRGASLELRPKGNAPTNGGTIRVGERFTIELWLNPGTNTDIVAQQSYLSFTHGLLQNSRSPQYSNACELSATITPDFSALDVALQNEVCNGPECQFRGEPVPPGMIRFSSGALNNPPIHPNRPVKLGEMTFCATAVGEAGIRWLQPSTPTSDKAPGATLRTGIVDAQGRQVLHGNPLSDYTIKVINNDK